MKTKQVLEQIELMNDSLANELNSIVADMRNKPNKSDIQTIAEHVQELEEKVDKLGNQIFAINEKDGEHSVGKKVYPDEKPKIADPDKKEVYYPNHTLLTKLGEIEFILNPKAKPQINFDKLTKEMDRAEKLIKDKYGKKAERETVQFNGEPLEVTEMQKELLLTLLKKYGEFYTVSDNIRPEFEQEYHTQTDYFLKAKNLLIEYAEKTMIKKGIEYTPVGDRFANFRPILGEKKTAIEKLIGYNAKHVQYCFMQNENASYPSDTYKRENTAIGYIFGFGETRANWIKENLAELKYQHWISMQPQTDAGGDNMKYESFKEWRERLVLLGQITNGSCSIIGGYAEFSIYENKEYYKQCYISELLEHWGDVFNYNVLGLAMQDTDKEPYYIVPYSDRTTQEKEIKGIVESIKSRNNLDYAKIEIDSRYEDLLNSISRNNLFDIIYLFAKQLERLEGK